MVFYAILSINDVKPKKEDGAKARAISDALHPTRMDPNWMLKSFVDKNPFVWMAEVNGVLVDIREMPREVQVIAYAKGMIPYIPADQK